MLLLAEIGDEIKDYRQLVRRQSPEKLLNLFQCYRFHVVLRFAH